MAQSISAHPVPGGCEGSEPNVPIAGKTPGLRPEPDCASQPNQSALSSNPSGR